MQSGGREEGREGGREGARDEEGRRTRMKLSLVPSFIVLWLRHTCRNKDEKRHLSVNVFLSSHPSLPTFHNLLPSFPPSLHPSLPLSLPTLKSVPMMSEAL